MKKRYKILIGIVLLLGATRIYLPYVVTDYVNKILKEIPGYTGSITDVDLQLYKGAYSIDSLEILKADSSIYVPFFSSHRIDLSVQWSALFEGSIVGEIDLINPELYFVASNDTSQAQYGEDVDWTKPIKELIPLKINRLEVHEGTIYFKNFDNEPKIDLYLTELELKATNLTNATSENKSLPSELTASGYSIGGGQLNVSGGLNILKKIPDVDIDMNFEGVDLTALNDFLKVYAKMDAEKGTFNLYSEIVIDDGQLTGYVKPLIRDLELVSWQDDKNQPLQLIWESVAGVVLEIFENQKKDQLATKVPMKGDLSNPKTKVFPAIWNILSNAFVQAFKKSTDDTLDFEQKEDR